MMAENPERKKLSKSILEMKFMKKTKDKIDQEQYMEEGRAMFASDLTESMRITGSKVVIEPSFVPCEDLINGRLSYHGMNPEIEKLTAAEKSEETSRVEKKDDEVEISDMEMARRYSNLVGTIGNKFKTKANRKAQKQEPPTKRPKFMKPGDD